MWLDCCAARDRATFFPCEYTLLTLSLQFRILISPYMVTRLKAINHGDEFNIS